MRQNNLNIFYKLTGVVWFVIALMLCNGGDVFLKLIGTTLPHFQVTFFRFFFSLLFLLPFVFFQGLALVFTPYIKAHIIRALLLVLATTFWIKGVPSVDLTIVTLVGLSIPIVILPICHIWLKEKMSFDRMLVTILALGSIVLALQPNLAAFNFDCLWLLLSIVLYGGLDVVNKKYADKDSLLNMLFYSAFFGTFFSLPGAITDWEALHNTDLLLLSVLGASANLILFCIIKAYQRLEMSVLAPFHYLEFPQSMLMGKIIFNEPLQGYTIIGVIINVCLSIYLTYREFFMGFFKKPSESARFII